MLISELIKILQDSLNKYGDKIINVRSVQGEISNIDSDEPITFDSFAADEFIIWGE